ncbi:hypothetical protein SDC9_45958 [bioreactor metagenome]|uniref:Glycosyl-4,4'-diaponeurosporenoate acyltransferase n=1 Tax=bioreactor metagenome TaxID=1076179 RepID=A0A644W871_9ZZZZ
MELNTGSITAANVFFALLFFVGVNMISIYPAGMIRDWVFTASFEGMSRTHIKKILKGFTRFQKISLQTAAKYNNPQIARKRIAVYYLYWVYTLIVAVLLALSALGRIAQIIPELLWFVQMAANVVIFLFHPKSGND